MTLSPANQYLCIQFSGCRNLHIINLIECGYFCLPSPVMWISVAHIFYCVCSLSVVKMLTVYRMEFNCWFSHGIVKTVTSNVTYFNQLHLLLAYTIAKLNAKPSALKPPTCGRNSWCAGFFKAAFISPEAQRRVELQHMCTTTLTWSGRLGYLVDENKNPQLRRGFKHVTNSQAYKDAGHCATVAATGRYIKHYYFIYCICDYFRF